MLWAHVFCPQIGKSHWSLLPNTLNSPVLATRRLESPLLRHQKRSPVQQVTQEGYPLTSVQVVGSQAHCKTFFSPFLSVYVCVCSRECGRVCATLCMGEGRGQKATSASSSFLSSSCEAGSRYCCVYQTSCPVACDLPGTSCPSFLSPQECWVFTDSGDLKFHLQLAQTLWPLSPPSASHISLD